MLWRYEERDGRKTKPPLNPHTGLRGDVTDPSHGLIMKLLSKSINQEGTRAMA